MKKLFLILTILLSAKVFAQNGTIRGTVIDDETGETVIGANVAVLDPLMGTSTDLDGAFSISIAPGTYQVRVSFISYQNITINDVVVKAGEVTSLGTIRMTTGSLDLDEVVVTATATRRSEAALNTMKKKSATMMDGISAQKMALTGDGSAVEAAQRVTGVSIEGGKYIYVRGLGDRYSKVTLNQMNIPGLDPDRNSLQMDIFPTNLIDNIVVAKNFTADLPADFTGGLVNVETKAFPEEKIIAASAGISFNPDMHFNDEYLTYEGGSTDWLGFDDGTRDLPSSARSPNVPTVFRSPDEEVRAFTQEFDPNLDAYRETSFMDYSMSFTLGNQIDLNKDKENRLRNPKLGYIFSLSYKNQQRYYDDVTYAEYQRNETASENELVYADLQEGNLGTRNNQLGILTGLAYKTKLSKYRFTLMHLQSGESKAAEFQLDQNPAGIGRSGYTGFSDNLEYNERFLTNFLLDGTHAFDGSNWEVDWRLSPTFSTANDPDVRKTAFTTAIDTSFQAGNAGLPSRIWRELDEITLTGRIDVTKKHKLNGEDAKLKIGLMETYRQREYEILEFGIQFGPGGQDWDTYNPNEVLDPKNIWPNRPNNTYIFSTLLTPNPNAYEANSSNLAAYISEEFNISPSLKTVLGVRMENFTMRHTGRDISGAQTGGIQGNVLDDEVVLEGTDFFPSVNLIYTLAEEMNLRFGFSRTIARPSFKELSFAQIIDPTSNRTFNGALFDFGSDWDGNMQSTYINNFDLRWEFFMERGQIYSISAFYKQFENPIELVRISVNTTGFEYQPRNVGDGQVFGIELEATKSLERFGDKFKHFSVSGNLTLVESRIEMNEAEIRARENGARDGQEIEDFREMSGQAPYVINFGLTYNNVENGLRAGLFYNVKGPTLQIVGTSFFPDIYQQPFHNLTLGVSKQVGENKNTTIDLNVDNILGDVRESFFESYQAASQVYTQFSPGRMFSLSVSHRF
ncbi:MAG: TonB-dependent receptor [Flavobacteriales bacterium]|nr:TonB-dependent receptor [Flavobacteriales bacterium]